MVGIVVVSHSGQLARGVVELARAMAGPDVVVAEAGGLDDGSVGTDAQRVVAAIEEASSPDGVLVLMDLGSAVLSAELALELLDAERRDRVLLCEAPLVEGAVSAATAARLGLPLAEVAAEARAALQPKAAHLGGGRAGDEVSGREPPPGVAHELRLVVENPLGLHARPAARLVRAAGALDAVVEVRNLTAGRGPAPARSLNALSALGVRQGDEILVSARGPQAAEALAAVEALAAQDFGDEPSRPGPGGAPGRRPGAAGGLQGVPASPGVAAGPIRRVRRVAAAALSGPGAGSAAERGALERARGAARRDLAALRDGVARRAGEHEASIFDVHILLVDDEALVGPAEAAIEAGETAARAWDGAVQAAASRLRELEDPYQRERAADVVDVGQRVLDHLLDSAPPTVAGPGILVAADLTPTDAAAIDRDLLLGIATAGGGPLGHGAILARALAIPAVVALGESVLALEEGVEAVVDGDAGTLLVDPPPAVLAECRERQVRRTPVATGPGAGPAVTRDGVRVPVCANAGSGEEAARAAEAGADGIGLLRTEFLFLSRPDLPGEEEQADRYRAVAAALRGRPVTIRTLDAGADKPLPALAGELRGEENPALGVRGLRLGLARPETLRPQLRAVLRVAIDHPVRVMFPMVTTVGELRQARSLLDAAAADLGVAASLPVGVMVEVPAAALCARTLAADVDFFSIGTNDLTQYALAADRTNASVGALADALHPAVLRLVEAVTAAAAERGIPVAVCGELAADPAAVPVLLGLGVDELSVRVSALAATRAAVGTVDRGEARGLAAAALSAESAEAVRHLVAAGGGGGVAHG